MAAMPRDKIGDGVAQRLEAQLPARAGVGERIAE
jgi:hypothetical protein